MNLIQEDETCIKIGYKIAEKLPVKLGDEVLLEIPARIIIGKIGENQTALIQNSICTALKLM